MEKEELPIDKQIGLVGELVMHRKQYNFIAAIAFIVIFFIILMIVSHTLNTYECYKCRVEPNDSCYLLKCQP